MPEDNHITDRELEAHLGPIRSDIREIKNNLKEIADSQWLGPQGRTFIAGAGLISAMAAIVIAVLH